MARGTGNKRIVLVVEDEALQRKDLEETLTGAGFAVITASRVDEALRILDKRADISAIVTDIKMPGAADGFVVAWRGRRQARPLPVIVVSAHVKAGHEEPAMGLRYVPKPYNPAVLVAEVNKALAAAPTPQSSGATTLVKRTRARADK
jgi:CheY-like chemotaxis protein